MALPAIDAIIEAWQPAAIDIYVGQHSSAAFAFRSSVAVRPAPNSLTMGSALNLSRILRSERYDAVVSLDRSRWLRMAMLTSRASTTAGVVAESRERRHETEVYLDVVRSLGIPTSCLIPRITPTMESERRAADMLDGLGGPVAILHPGGAQNPGVDMLDKRWPVDRFVALARSLTSDGVETLISGGPDDISIAHRVRDGAGLAERAVLAGKTSIETMAAVLRRSAVFVGPDTGLSHLAAAVGTPTVVIFGPTNPRRYRPLGSDVRVLAPVESWQIEDRDLRQQPKRSIDASTRQVRLAEVLSTTRAAIAESLENRPC